MLGSIDLSWSLHKELPYYLSVYGSAGTMHVGWKESKYRRANDSDWITFGHGYDKLQAFGSQIDNFVRSVRGLEPPLITLQDAMASVDVIHASYNDLRSTCWEPVGTTAACSVSIA